MLTSIDSETSIHVRGVIKTITLLIALCIKYLDDNSRVKLIELPDKPGSDYINASFISVSIILSLLLQ